MGKKRIIAETGAGQHGVATVRAARCGAALGRAGSCCGTLGLHAWLLPAPLQLPL